MGPSPVSANSQLKANVAELIQLANVSSCFAARRGGILLFSSAVRWRRLSTRFRLLPHGRPVFGQFGSSDRHRQYGAAIVPVYNIPGWPWNGSALTEVGYPAALPAWDSGSGMLSLALNPFAARVFQT